ncbi:TetR family transcriptional regulator [Arenicella chitinivorans]|uniref:TetR family transcriptional regulator n=1 Tax=Arenicella chitinivorans TaxID=1329800 RepID=A0A918S1A4_9GAMM|nr:TetR/AcrR family transcriptional regulator [Arenicella chitinivorans]GHA18843.1 TetR family transcriptional regulator [Arenicella chitinivorans]
MAKTVQFDRQKVIDKAMNLYWAKGFHATSMRNLQDEIDLRPGSIYSAFGSKDGLFKESLRNYANMGLAQIRQLTAQHSSPIAALKAFVNAQVVDTLTDAPNGMCMLCKTLSELTTENQDLIDATKRYFGEISAEIVALIEQAQIQGEVDANKNPQALAEHVQIQIAGLRSFAKINNDKAQLGAKVESIFSHYPF